MADQHGIPEDFARRVAAIVKADDADKMYSGLLWALLVGLALGTIGFSVLLFAI